MIIDVSRNHHPQVCKVCESPKLMLLDQILLLGRYSADLTRCKCCGYTWFDSAEVWLDEAYTTPIASTDTGIVARSLDIHRIISAFMCFSRDPGRILDWGSGSGLLIRLLRDDGYDCYGLEPFTDPVLDPAHSMMTESEALANGPYRVITAIEVVEHLACPRVFFTSALSKSDTIIFTTEIINKLRHDKDWWYFSKETGQHISFHTVESLSFLAGIHGCKYGSNGKKNMHIITRNYHDLWLFRMLAGVKRARVIHPLCQIYRKLVGQPSLIMKDHIDAKQSLRLDHFSKSE